MASTRPQDTSVETSATPAQQQVNIQLTDFTDAIVSAVNAGKPKRVLFHEYKPITKFNPTGKRVRELPYKVFQNGSPLHTDTLTDREIELLGKLKAGTFVDGLVKIFMKDMGGDVEWHILYSCKTLEQRMNFKDHVRNFTDLLEQVVNGPAAA